jgi:predicted ABC-type ATPase
MLHYVLLAKPALHVARVGQRVALGGHDIPAQKIADRYARSLDQLPWFAKQATLTFIWDNSLRAGTLGAIPLIAEKGEDGSWQAHVTSGHLEGMDDNVLSALRRIGIAFE